VIILFILFDTFTRQLLHVSHLSSALSADDIPALKPRIAMPVVEVLWRVIR
jgi:hypothetical protein